MIDDIKFYLKQCGLEALVNPGLWGLIYYRMGHAMVGSKFRKINPFWYVYLVLNTIYILFFKIELPATCVIGKRLYLPHAYGLVMGPQTVIGDDVTIGPWVVIGHNFDERCPTIEDNCYIGPKATLLGGITIGRSSKVGANTVVTKDIAADSTISINRMINNRNS